MKHWVLDGSPFLSKIEKTENGFAFSNTVCGF